MESVEFSQAIFNAPFFLARGDFKPLHQPSGSKPWLKPREAKTQTVLVIAMPSRDPQDRKLCAAGQIDFSKRLNETDSFMIH